MKKYLKIWWIYTQAATQIAFTSRISAVLFIFGKLLRYIAFLTLIVVITAKTKTIAGYTLWQMVLFFLTFNVIDTSAQLFLRDVYRFRGHIVSGYFDYILTKPFPALFKSLLGGSDILDVPILLFSISALFYTFFQLKVWSLFSMFLYGILLLNAFAIAISFHIIVLCFGILTTEVDNAIMLYRDITQMGRVPVDIYKEPLKGLVTFIIPVGVMMTFPAKSVLGLLSWNTILLAIFISGVLFFISIQFWKFALKNYSSASS